MASMEDLKKDKYSTGSIGKMVGKTYQTISLHRERGLIHMEKDPVGGHWYATKQDVIDYLKAVGCWEDLERKPAIYARVSSHDQKKHGDLDRQIGRLCQKAPGSLIYSDVGSGLNTERKGLNKLIKDIQGKKISTVYITHKDRLTRFGYGYLEKMFEAYDTKIIITESKPDKSAQEELVDDMVSLLASFSEKLYGMRSSQRKQLAEQVKEIIKEPETEKGEAGYGKEDKRDSSLSEGIFF